MNKLKTKQLQRERRNDFLKGQVLRRDLQPRLTEEETIDIRTEKQKLKKECDTHLSRLINEEKEKAFIVELMQDRLKLQFLHLEPFWNNKALAEYQLRFTYQWHINHYQLFRDQDMHDESTEKDKTPSSLDSLGQRMLSNSPKRDGFLLGSHINQTNAQIQSMSHLAIDEQEIKVNINRSQMKIKTPNKFRTDHFNKKINALQGQQTSPEPFDNQMDPSGQPETQNLIEEQTQGIDLSNQRQAYDLLGQSPSNLQHVSVTDEQPEIDDQRASVADEPRIEYLPNKKEQESGPRTRNKSTLLGDSVAEVEELLSALNQAKKEQAGSPRGRKIDASDQKAS